MHDNNQICFDKIQFNRFLDEETDPTEEARILTHIESCQKCQSSLEQLAGDQDVWSEIKSHLAENRINSIGDETHEYLGIRDRRRDLKKIQQMLGPTDNPDMLGRIGVYEVCGMIGRGSAGVVLKALDTRLNRFVAIKLLAPVYSNNGSSRRRFEREARAIASVKDPNVIPVHTVGEYQGTPYIVMQYVPDGSLQQRIERTGPLETSEVVCVAMQIAKGLAAAHKRGIVHRDVKPANVLLESGVDSAMVTDFGLARVVDEATMTRSGAISGTPQYMSPEQAKGESVDPRSDLFSLGSVMYAASTGHSPFRAESIFGVIKRVCESRPRPIRESNPEIAEWLVAFIAKLHSKNKEDRFESATQVADLLSNELARLQSPTIVPQPDREWWDKPKKSKLEIGKKTVFGSFFAAATVGLALLVWSGSGSFDFSSNREGSPPASTGSARPLGGNSLLAFTTQENEKLDRFKNSVETTIDVKSGGSLFLRTNLGTLNIKTHNKPTVEMTLVHTVAAKDKKTADKMFKSLKMNYELDGNKSGEAKLVKGQDAAIVAAFPTRTLSDHEIEESNDFEELKEALLIRNNSHFRNAEFEIRIPKKFNLDLETLAGPIRISDVSGSAKCMTRAGYIEVNKIGGDLEARTLGGHIDVGEVDGDFLAHTKGGHIHADRVNGSVDAESLGGHIDFGITGGHVHAVSMGGGITIWKANASVDAKSPAGAISVNFIKQPGADSILKSETGSIHVGYIEGMGFDIEAKCELGKITGPFVDTKTNRLQHRVNDGQNKLTATAVIGSIEFSVIDEEQIDQELEQVSRKSRGQRAFQQAYDLHMVGKIDEAIDAHKVAAEYEDYRGIATYNLGCAWALKGEHERAYVALNKAVKFGFIDLKKYENDPDLDSLRSDDRFSQLISKLVELSEQQEN